MLDFSKMSTTVNFIDDLKRTCAFQVHRECPWKNIRTKQLAVVGDRHPTAMCHDRGTGRSLSIVGYSDGSWSLTAWTDVQPEVLASSLCGTGLAYEDLLNTGARQVLFATDKMAVAAAAFVRWCRGQLLA